MAAAEPRVHMVEVPLDDKQHAERIRTLTMQLHASITKAQEAGLKIETNLHEIGTPTWKGYLDAVRIIRVL